MENVRKKKIVQRIEAFLLTLLMLVGCLPFAQAAASGQGLTPDPVHYINGEKVTNGGAGDVILSKTAERIGPDEWKVTVEAEIKRTVGRPQPNLELVVVLDTSGSMAWCTDEVAHTAGSHAEHKVNNGCYELICTNTNWGHNHSTSRGCYTLNCTKAFVKHTTNDNTPCSYLQGSSWVDYAPSRLTVAKNNITSLVSSLNRSTSIEKKEIDYVIFSSNNNVKSVDSLNNVKAEGGTYMYTGIQKGLTMFNKGDDYRKVLIVVTDGAASDSDEKDDTLELLEEYKEEENVAVFTVGFSYENAVLAEIAGNGGSYVHAGNQVELEKAFQGIEDTIRAMMVDPMGTTVGFDSNSFDVSLSEVAGNVSYVGNTLYWNPTGDSVPAGSKVSYSYTVKLNDQANTDRGSHSGVELNDPTDFLYSITSNNNVTHYSAAFPIPKASYKISTLKERWVNENGQNIVADSSEEKIITDYSNAVDDGVHRVYTPAFETDYRNPVQSIPISSNNTKFYQYQYSTVTKNNSRLDAGIDGIEPYNESAAYVVTHHYKKVDGYKVSYSYTGDVPDSAVDASTFNTMAQAGDLVQVAENPTVGGYRFLGWECQTSGVSVADGKFTMPSKNVAFVGRWEKVHSYQVYVNYYYVIEGDYSKPIRESTSDILLEHVNCDNGNTVSYTIGDQAWLYNGNTYTSAQLGSAPSGVSVSGQVINGIVPGSGTVPRIVVNLYRDVKRDYELNVKHVFKDNSTHDGYPSAYPDVAPKYQYDQPWDVSNLGAPEGYALVMNESGVAVSGTDASLAQAGVLKGDAFGKGDKYVILTYEKQATHQVTVHYISEDPTKATLTAADYISSPAYAGSAYDVSAQLPATIEADGKVWHYSGDALLTGDAVSGTLDSNKEITAKYYLQPTYSIAATYTTVTDGVSASEEATASGTGEAGETVPFSQTEYDSKVAGFTAEHFQNDLKVNGTAANTLPVMEKFGHYEVTLSYLRQVNNAYQAVVKYQDQDGKELKSPAMSEETAFGLPYDMESAKLDIIEADGVKYLFLSDDTADNQTAYTGSMPKGGVQIIRTYQPAPKHTVTYQYTGDVPADPPQLPEDQNTYYEGEEVTVLGDVSKEGYTFSGWTTTDASITGNTFSMPGQNVVLVGGWTKKPSYQVIVRYYTITDGEKAAESDQIVDTQVVYCDTTDSVAIPYEKTLGSVVYGSPVFVENTAGATLDEGNHQVVNITPATSTAKVVLELTRTVISSAEYKVVHQYYTVDPDQTETRTETDVTEAFVGNHKDSVAAADIADHVISGYERVSDTGDIVLDKDAPKTITITYKRYLYRVTIDGDEGVEIISGKTAAEGGTIHSQGDDVSVSFTIKEGYLLTGMQVDDHELRNTSNVVSFPAISANHRVVLTTALRQKGTAAVHFVDEEGNALKDSLVTDEMYIGDQFNVSQALEVEMIKLGNSEYTFDRHFQKRNMVRSTNGMMTLDNADYIGQMPAGGVEIIRVYKLDKVTCYYQVKKVYTGYDANGAVIYSAMEEGPVTETGNLEETVNLPDSSVHGDYGFRLVSDAVMTADLTGSTKEAPHVFIAYYEIRQGDEPVPGTQLPPGLTPPADTEADGTTTGASAGAGELPPRTGDDGVGHWAVLMALAGMGLVMLLMKRRREC